MAASENIRSPPLDNSHIDILRIDIARFDNSLGAEHLLWDAQRRYNSNPTPGTRHELEEARTHALEMLATDLFQVFLERPDDLRGLNALQLAEEPTIQAVEEARRRLLAVSYKVDRRVVQEGDKSDYYDEADSSEVSDTSGEEGKSEIAAISNEELYLSSLVSKP
ncbi:hypothetical protein B0H19DRAFT_1271415 [Mycena capillaripes]|nr:hypothetical protein B0H19DRAFT_1271415 [Mycena capillaripes]